MTDWFARPILHVKDVEASLRFYVNRLGFTCPWRYEDSGKLYVAQVERLGCSLILSNSWADTTPDKIGKAVIFISLNVEPASYEAEVAAVDALRAEFQAKDVTVTDGWWGYKLLIIDDPDGNQLLFNYSNKPAASTDSQ